MSKSTAHDPEANLEVHHLTDDELNAVAGGFRITNVNGNANWGPVLHPYPSPQAPPVVLYHEPVHT